MCARILTVCCLLAILSSPVAAREGTITLGPKDVAGLKAAGITVVHRVLNGNEHAFEITAEVPKDYDSLDATFEVRNDQGLVTYCSWQSSDGKCIAVFMVGEQALKDAVFTVQPHKGDRFAPFLGIRNRYVLKLVDFALGDDSPKEKPAQPAAKGNEDVFSHERCCVTIWPAKTQVSAGEEFEVKLRVVNSSDEPQSFQVSSCSWDRHWKSSNPHLGYKPWPCYANAIIAVQLQPGEAYEKVLVMKLVESGASKTESLRMGFAPAGEQKTYWSNEVVLGVK